MQTRRRYLLRTIVFFGALSLSLGVSAQEQPPTPASANQTADAAQVLPESAAADSKTKVVLFNSVLDDGEEKSRTRRFHDRIAKLTEVTIADWESMEHGPEERLITVIVPPTVVPERIAELINEVKNLGLPEIHFILRQVPDDPNAIIVEHPSQLEIPSLKPLWECLKAQHDFQLYAAGKKVNAAASPAAPTATTKVFALKNARSADAARVVEQLFVQNQGGLRGLSTSVAVDVRTNSVIVRGESEALAEIEALLLRLDDGAKVGDAAADSGTKSLDLDIVITGQGAGDLRQQYDTHERQARGLSEQLRKTLPDPATGEKLKSQLRDAVRQAFETRQKLQRAELAEFAERLQGIQQSIEMREKIGQQIIDRRVQELLDPHLKWERPSLQPAPVAPAYSRPIRFHDPGLEVRVTPVSDDDLFWKLFGARFTVVAKDELTEKFRGGLKISELRPGGPAEKSGLRVSDIVIGVDRWETLSLSNLNFVWQETANQETVRILVQRSSSVRKEAHWTNLKWDLDAVTGKASGISRVGQASISSATKPVDPLRVTSAKTVKVQALLFDLDEKSDEFDLSKVQHDAPAELDVMLIEAVSKGRAAILSRPQMITRLNEEAKLFVGQEVALSQSENQVAESAEVGVKIAITPREEVGKPVLRVAFEFSRVDPGPAPFIQSNSGELTVRMNEYGGNGKLLGPFKAVPGKHRFLHLIVTLTEGVAASPTPENSRGGSEDRQLIPLEPTAADSASDGSRRSATSLPLAHGKSPSEFHELLAQRAEQVRQIRGHIERYEARIAEGKDVEDSRRSLESVRRQLDEYSRKQKLAWEEYRQLLKVYEQAGEGLQPTEAKSAEADGSRSPAAAASENSGKAQDFRAVDSSQSDSNSPQAVLDAMRRFQERKDHAGFVALLSDEEVARLTGIMLQTAVSFSQVIGLLEKSPNSAANPDLLELKKINAIVDRYTVDDPDEKAQESFQKIASISERQMAGQIPGAESPQAPLPDWNAEQYSLHLRTAARVISDQRAFLADMMKAAEQFNPSQVEAKAPAWRVEINGDLAIATADASSTKLGFMTPAKTQLKRVDGQWRITSLTPDEHLMMFLLVPDSSKKTETPAPSAINRGAATPR